MLEKILGITVAFAESEAADAGAAGDAQTVSPLLGLVQFLPLILVFVVFWFMLIRPQRKKDKQVKEMLNNLKTMLRN